MTKPLTPEERQNLRTNWLEAAQASAEGGASIEVVRSDLLELIDWTWRLLDECAMHERSGVMLLNWMKEDADFRLQCPKCLVERSGPAMWVEGNRARCCCVPCHQKARRVHIAGYSVCEDCPYRAHVEAPSAVPSSWEVS